MHRLLKRQLKKINYDNRAPSEEQFEKFLSFVDRAYCDSDDDRKLLENTLDISSKEMFALYKELEEKSKSKLALSEERYKYLAQHDALTGISNRLNLEEQLKVITADSKRNNKKFAVLFLDLDYFKHINDTLGHDIGDELLKEVSKRILKNIRKSDVFARIGGDEFVVVQSDVQKNSLIVHVEKLIKVIREPCIIGKHELHISTSIGIAVYPDDGEDGLTLMKHADIAMYRVKDLGRDDFAFYTQKLNAKVHEDMLLQQGMSSALESGEFELYFQPKVQYDGDKIIGSEALLRWNHSDLGLIFPDSFIGIAESSGFISKLGRFVIEESCRSIARMNLVIPGNKIHLSVNLSIRQIQRDDIYTIVKNALEKTGVEPSQFSLEITESVIEKNSALLVEQLNKIKSLGIRICLDDFGTGYSSLSYLSRLPIDTIKIDKSFVDEVSHGKNILVDTIISMAKSLNMNVIAEGVEREYQKEYLKNQGCTLYQGFLFSEAIPEREYLKMLENSSKTLSF